MDTKPFEPKIVAFMCNWCTYGAADLAGVSRLPYPQNIRPIRVMCSATISPHHILRAFQSGADGVFIGGCHIGDCHYIKGNYMTIKRVAFMEDLLNWFGLEGRLHLEWISSAEAQKFVDVIRRFTEKIRALGPNPIPALLKTPKAIWNGADDEGHCANVA
ncbi:F420-non-reducing hydrogenase subunit D [Desulfacinum hydrothermale DSM 13146]|uniref:F420-non-reducing hydrogenase subunit D n=1 Tax=Desulfacinum hydrothermale DSM 13146 TaxID=1121390 RepID=A0A1W1X4P3_9BACT|nr:F420-non-reducing hydrogenase subunit D [Desulfacinum hydrothermale DSM 13146]